MSVHHPNKNIHKIGPSPKKRVSKLNVIIEESDYKRVNENSESNETSILNDQSKSSQASQQNINNSMYLPR